MGVIYEHDGFTTCNSNSSNSISNQPPFELEKELEIQREKDQDHQSYLKFSQLQQHVVQRQAKPRALPSGVTLISGIGDAAYGTAAEGFHTHTLLKQKQPQQQQPPQQQQQQQQALGGLGVFSSVYPGR
jgi:hypothetical protein